MAKRSIHGLRTILTGASSGIGMSLAKQLAGHGAKLILNARREDRLAELVQVLRETGAEAHGVVGDVTEPAVRAAILAAAQQQWAGLDCLVNNAGMGGIGNFAENDEARLRRIMEVNFFAPLELIRLCLPELRKTASVSKSQRTLIVNVASVLGHRAIPKKSEYCASKFALHGFSDSLRSEVADDGIDVLLVSPSTTDTEFFDVALGDKAKLPWLTHGQSSAAVAKAAVRAMRRGNHEVILTIGGKAMVWFDRLFPTLTDLLVRRFA